MEVVLGGLAASLEVAADRSTISARYERGQGMGLEGVRRSWDSFRIPSSLLREMVFINGRGREGVRRRAGAAGENRLEETPQLTRSMSGSRSH